MVNEQADRDRDRDRDFQDRDRDHRPSKKPRISDQDRPSSPTRLPAPAPSRLLLANLPYHTTENDIEDFFRDAGADVDRVSLVKVNPGNRVNGNAYVYVQDDRSVDIALNQDAREFHGRKLRVSSMPHDQRTACVRGMPLRSTAQDLHDLFRGCTILDVRSRPVKGGPPGMNTWFVDFSDDQSFREALAKDQSMRGLMICIATAQSRSTPRPSRDHKRDDEPAPPRDSEPPRSDRGRDDRSRDDRSRDDYERAPERRESFDRSAPEPSATRHDDRDRDYSRSQDEPRGERGPSSNGMPNTRYRSRSRSPTRFDRDRRDYSSRDRRDLDYSRDRPRHHSPDRYRDRDRDYDRRDRERDYDRRDYRRDYDSRHDYRRDRDRDRGWGRDNRDGRDSRDGWDSRDARDGRDGRSRSDRDLCDMSRQEREIRESVLDPAITAVLTNLPFCEDRGLVVTTLRRTLEDLGKGLKISDVIPVGRRCGASIVIFRDEQSHSRAVGLGSIPISARKVNILPLEVPSVARVQKLHSGYAPEEILNDMRRNYGVETLFIKKEQADQLLLGIDDSRYLVRLLDIDGRPLLHSRYATVSYIPSRNNPDGMGSRPRRSPDDYKDPNGRGGGGSFKDRDNRDDRPDSPDDHRRSDDGDRKGSNDQPSRSGDREQRSYQQKDGEWVVRLRNISRCISKDDMRKALDAMGLEKVFCEDDISGTLLIGGGETGEAELNKLLNTDWEAQSDDDMFKGTTSSILSMGLFGSGGKKRNLSPHHDDDSPHSPSKKKQNDDTVQWSDSKNDPSMQAKPAFKISPMTPSPGDYVSIKPKRPPIDPELPQVGERLERLRSTIMQFSSKDISGENYGEFCSNLQKLCKPQTLIYTHSKVIDPPAPHIWTGTVAKGALSRPGRNAKAKFAITKSNCKGFLVLRSAQEDERVRETMRALPKDILMEVRAKWTDDAFSHLLTPTSVVAVVKSKEDADMEKSGKKLKDVGSIGNTELFAGMMNSLRIKQRMGVGRYTHNGKKFISLCIPPNPYVFEQLRLPWRFREYAGHNTMLLLVGEKASPKI